MRVGDLEIKKGEYDGWILIEVLMHIRLQLKRIADALEKTNGSDK